MKCNYKWIFIRISDNYYIRKYVCIIKKVKTLMKGRFFSSNTNFLCLSIILLLLTHGNIFPQTNWYLDSLTIQLSKARNPQDSVICLTRIIWEITSTQSDLAFNYGKKSLQLSNRIQNQETIAEIYDAVAFTYWAKKDLAKTKEYYGKALRIANKYNYKFRIGWEYYHLAEIAKDERDVKSVIEYSQKSKKAWKELNYFDMVLKNDWLIFGLDKNKWKADADTIIHDINIALKQTSNSGIQMDLYSDLIHLYGKLDNKKQSIIYALKVLDLAEHFNNEKAIYNAYQQIAVYLRDSQHNYEVALLYYQKILELCKSPKLELTKAFVLNDIGQVYKLMNNETLALSYFNQSLEIGLRKNHKHTIANAYKSIGEFYYLKKNYDESLTNYKKCYEIGCDKCPRIAFHHVLLDIGNVYLISGDNNNALKYFNKSLNLADSSNALSEKAASLEAIGDYYKKNNNLEVALKNYNDALLLAASVHSLSLKKEITSKLSIVFREKKDFKKAYEYLTLSNIVSDSLDKITQIENISRLETKFELENIKIQANAELEKQVQLKYFFIIGFVLMSTLGFILYRGYRQKRKDNKILESQKQQLEKLATKVHKADEEKISFFTNISHELRTPLTLILGPTEKLLSENQKNENLSSSLEMIRRNALQLYNYINQLLDLRKLESGKEMLKVFRTDVYNICKTICSSFSIMASERNITVNFIPEEEKIVGWLDKSILEKILNNLLSNATKYTNAGGEINVYLYSKKSNENEIEEIKIVVSDNGVGIPEEQLKYIFDKYFQVANTNSGKSNGTGLGLAYTKELIELHKGKIIAESIINQGTTFIVTLPVKDKFYSESEKSKEEFISGDEIDSIGVNKLIEEQQTMLIIEDNADMREFIKTIFDKEYAIYEVEDGAAGFKMAYKYIPDIIISDIMMPGMNGLEFCSKLKNNIYTNHIPVLFLTAKTGDENEIKGFKTGADDYLTKPFNSEVLKIRIQRLIESRERLRQYFTKEFILNPSEVKLDSPENEFIRRAVKAVEYNIANPKLNVELLIEILGVSRTQLFRKLKAITGYSANQFIRNIKLKRAAQLLRKESYNITEVLYLSGFNSPSYFTTCFKEVYGCLPKEYLTKSEEPSILVN